LRRVAAEPARQIAESRPLAESRSLAESKQTVEPTARRARVGWCSNRPRAVAGGVYGQLIAAAAAMPDQVEVLALSATDPPPDSLDAIVTLGALPGGDREALPRKTDGTRDPLIVTLAPDPATSEHVRMLSHEADLVLSAHTHGRVVLATVLALLRWRGG
jgi:hypothetical protein